MPCPREIPLGHRLISPSLAPDRFDVVRDRNPAPGTLRPDEGARSEPACAIKCTGCEGVYALRGRQNKPATSLPLSALSVNCFVRPVTVGLSFLTGMDMPKALPACRRSLGLLFANQWLMRCGLNTRKSWI
jgi:hypothetical protein